MFIGFNHHPSNCPHTHLLTHFYWTLSFRDQAFCFHYKPALIFLFLIFSTVAVHRSSLAVLSLQNSIQPWSYLQGRIPFVKFKKYFFQHLSSTKYVYRILLILPHRSILKPLLLHPYPLKTWLIFVLIWQHWWLIRREP